MGLLEAPSLYSPNTYTLTVQSALHDHDVAMSALHTTNYHLENKMAKLRINTGTLRDEISTLRTHLLTFQHDLLVTWQADVLTRLIEIVYERLGRTIPWRDEKDVQLASRAYLIAAMKIDKATLRTKLGLHARYWDALGKYPQVVEFRSPDPRMTERAFAEWLVSEKENKPRMYEFWARLFRICGGRSVEEIAE